MGPHPAEAPRAAAPANASEDGSNLAKLSALKAQRRLRGECFKCGGKYNPTHKCPKQVSLAVMEELCATLPLDSATDIEDDGSASEASETENEQLHSLSSAAVTGTMSKKTMRLLGFVGQQQLLILVDSGSSANFISSSMVKLLNCSVAEAPVVQVTIANGTKMVSDKQISAFKWGVQQRPKLGA